MDSATTATNSGGLTKQSGFSGKHHDLATKARISQTQKARYNYMRQMMKQHQNEQRHFGPIFDIDNPEITQKIKDIVREILQAELKNAIPSKQCRQNIPIF